MLLSRKTVVKKLSHLFCTTKTLYTKTLLINVYLKGGVYYAKDEENI
jgi:hypothetical protein